MSVEVYYLPSCPYCQKALALLKKKGVEPIIYDVAVQPELWDESKKRSGRDTVPQIFIHDRHVGGCDDLHALEANGELDHWLAN